MNVKNLRFSTDRALYIVTADIITRAELKQSNETNA